MRRIKRRRASPAGWRKPPDAPGATPMWFLRLLAVVLLIALGSGFLLYVFTGKRAYLAFSGRLLRYGLVFALAVFALMFLERLAIIPL